MKFSEHAPGSKYTPEQIERIKYLLGIAKKDLSSRSLIGYHGTGLSSLNLLIKTGKLFGSPIKGHMADSHGIGNKGDLHFFPRAVGFPKDFDKSMALGINRYSIEDLEEERAVEGATSYAKNLSERDIFMESSGLDVTNPEHVLLFNEITILPFVVEGTVEECMNHIYSHPEDFRDILEIARKLKLDKSRLIEIGKLIQEEMHLRQGFVFGLDKKLLDRYGLKIGDDLGEDLFLNCPDGLDYTLLCGLRPLGQKEKALLKTLRSQV